jgi:hypothetical protein
MDQVIVTAKMIREARERREAETAQGAFNLSRARPLKELMAESRARKEAAAAAAAAASAVPAPVAAPAPAPVAALKTKEELFKIIGTYVKNLTPGDYQEYSRYNDRQRSYRIPKNTMPENVKKAVDALMGLRVEFQTIGEDGAKYTVQPTPSEFAIVVDTQDNWARQYVYRDVFESVGEALSDSNPYLSKNIKEIYKGAYNPEAPAPAPVAAPAAPAFMTLKERNAEKKNKVKEAVIEAAKNAQKVYDENKNKKTYYTGQIGINEKDLIGKAEEAIRSANSSKGGGTFISLTDKEFKKIVSKYYPKYYD